MRTGPLVLALGAFLLIDCATLDPLTGGTCGNGVVDVGEDCDSYAPAQFATGRCGGASEGAAACHLKCAGATDCPDGWGCSVTGICRAPSGSFARIGEPVSAGVDTLTLGDFDGDGRKDVIGSGPKGADRSAKIRVHYFGDDAVLAQVNALSAPIVTPAVHDFDGDGIDDFACGMSQFGAFGIFSGQKDRSLVPALFPSFRVPKVDVKPLEIRASGVARVPGGGESTYLFAGVVDTGSGRVDVLTSLGSGPEAYNRALPVGPEGIVGEPKWGVLRPGASDSACGEVVLALKPAGSNGSIEIFSPCKAGAAPLTSAWADSRPPIVIDAPEPLASGVSLVDVDGDRNVDVVLFGTRAADGEGHVYALRVNGTDFGAPERTALAELPLASDDVDGDGIVDFVLPSGVAMSRPRGLVGGGGTDAGADAGLPAGTLFKSHLVYTLGRRVRWTTAQIGRFNGDVHLDIAAASDEQPDIDFLSGAGEGLFTASTITTTGGVPRLTSGDFDGDSIRDIAFFQRRPGSTDTDLAIAYGRTTGVPDVSRVVGRTSSVLTFEPTRLGGTALDALSLFLREPAADAKALPDLALAIIVGNGDRQPVAPLVLTESPFTSGAKDPDPDVDREWSPLEVSIATAMDPNRYDLVALSVGYRVSRTQRRVLPGPQPARVWVAQARGGTAFETPIVVADLGTFSASSESGVVFDVRTVSGDIDSPRDGRTEFVAVRANPTGDGMQIQIVRPNDMGSPVTVPGVVYRRDAPLELVDVDGDGSLDLVTIVGRDDEARVVVFYNDGKAGFALPGVEVTLPSLKGGVDAARGFALVTTAGARVHEPGPKRRELAIVTKTRMFLAAPSREGRTKLDVRTVLGEAAPLSAATGIAAGDVDGDGVEDLAIADGGALRILRQVAR